MSQNPALRFLGRIFEELATGTYEDDRNDEGNTGVDVNLGERSRDIELRNSVNGDVESGDDSGSRAITVGSSWIERIISGMKLDDMN